MSFSMFESMYRTYVHVVVAYRFNALQQLKCSIVIDPRAITINSDFSVQPLATFEIICVNRKLDFIVYMTMYVYHLNWMLTCARLNSQTINMID